MPKREIQNHYLTNDGYEGWDFFKLLPTQGDRSAYSPLFQNSGGGPSDSQFKKSYDFYRRLRRHAVEGGAISPEKGVAESRRLILGTSNLLPANH